MNMRRYRGQDLNSIHRQIAAELGANAVIVSTRQEKTGNLLFGRHTVFEVVAATAEPAAPAAAPGSLQRLEELVVEQKAQFAGVRRTLKLMDDRLAELESDLRRNTLARTETGHRLLSCIHDPWQARAAELAGELAGDRDPKPDDWHRALAQLLTTRPGIRFRPSPGAGPNVYCLVGPTGVGKTTTLAKLAARCVLMERLNVGIITIDTFRVGAVDQVREYASLLGIDVHVAFSTAELAAQLARFADKDVVFVDTPGRSQYDQAGIRQIGDCLGDPTRLQVMLVLPAGVRQADARQIADSFRAIRPTLLVLTKVDEAAVCDGITQLVDSAGAPIVYLTDGQRVPEDIVPATAELVAALIARPDGFDLRLHAGGKAA